MKFFLLMLLLAATIALMIISLIAEHRGQHLEAIYFLLFGFVLYEMFADEADRG